MFLPLNRVESCLTLPITIVVAVLAPVLPHFTFELSPSAPWRRSSNAATAAPRAAVTANFSSSGLVPHIEWSTVPSEQWFIDNATAASIRAVERYLALKIPSRSPETPGPVAARYIVDLSVGARVRPLTPVPAGEPPKSAGDAADTSTLPSTETLSPGLENIVQVSYSTFDMRRIPNSAPRRSDSCYPKTSRLRM